MKAQQYYRRIQLAIVAGFLMLAASLMGAQNVSAINCDSNASARRACDLAGVDRGVAWINAVRTGSGIDSDKNIVASSDNGKITLYLHGAVYNAGGYVNAANATCLRILDYSVSNVKCADAPSTMAGVSLGSSTLFRGYSGYGKWSKNWESGAVRLTVDETVFTEDGKANADGTYSRTFHVYRCFNGNTGVPTACYSDAVTVTLRINNVSFSSSTTAALKVGGLEVASVTSAEDQWNQSNGRLAATTNYELSPEQINSTTIDWTYRLRRTDSNTSNNGALGYYIFTGDSTSNNASGWSSKKGLAAAQTWTVSNPVNGYSSQGVKVGDYVSAGDQNKLICRGIYHDAETKMQSDGSYQATEKYSSSRACVSVSYPYHFTLDKGVEISANALYIGEKGNLSYRVKQAADGDQTSLPDDLQYKVLYFYTGVDGNNASGAATFSGADYGTREIYRGSNTPSTAELCNRLGINTGAGGTGCAEAASGGISASTGQSGNLTAAIDIPDQAGYVGAKVCAAVATNYYTESGTFHGYGEGETGQVWGISAVTCAPIYKKPNLRVMTAPVYAAGGMNTVSASKTTPNYSSSDLAFGSWSEYLATTGSGQVLGFGSGAITSFGLRDQSDCARSPLTVANDNCAHELGQAGIETDYTAILTKVDNYLSRLENLRNSGGNGTGAISLGGNDFYYNTARSVCYYTGGDITISANIGDYIQCTTVIVRSSGDIHIAGDVTRVEAWLIADGSVYTCDQFGDDPSGLSSDGGCAAALTIAGPVYASQLYANRTANADGQGGASGDARLSDAASAEVFDYSASTYVWAYEESVSTDVRIYESYTQELAPRA